tara:strand:+ start:238 stop:609 length:372 start_codon:yes stop_codon:yes gene_type:complete
MESSSNISDSTENILKITRSLRRDLDRLSQSQIEELYKDFRGEFPKLYALTMSPDFEEKKLIYLLSIKDKIYKDKNTTKMEGDIQVGECLAQQYIYPIVGAPTLEQRQQALGVVEKKIASQKK